MGKIVQKGKNKWCFSAEPIVPCHTCHISQGGAFSYNMMNGGGGGVVRKCNVGS